MPCSGHRCARFRLVETRSKAHAKRQLPRQLVRLGHQRGFLRLRLRESSMGRDGHLG